MTSNSLYHKYLCLKILRMFAYKSWHHREEGIILLPCPLQRFLFVLKQTLYEDTNSLITSWMFIKWYLYSLKTVYQHTTQTFSVLLQVRVYDINLTYSVNFLTHWFFQGINFQKILKLHKHWAVIWFMTFPNAGWESIQALNFFLILDDSFLTYRLKATQ